jgi:hypothetical protein
LKEVGVPAERHERRTPGPKSVGVESRRLLAELQARALATAPDAVILVEGLSDYFAVEAAALRSGRNLERERVAVVPMDGATNLGRFLAHFGPSGLSVRLAGLCDLAEAGFFSRTLARVGLTARADRVSMASAGFFVCVRDLEDELIRALGPRRVEAIVTQEGELGSLRRLQQMPFHRGRTVDEQLHRFMGVRSGRKYRYAPLLVEALDSVELPRPLHSLLAYV